MFIMRGGSIGMIGDITLSQIMFGMGAGLLIAGGISGILWLISYIINWKWWKKEHRKDFADLRFFFNHREEIKKCIENSASKKRGEL